MTEKRYAPLAWPADSLLSPSEQATVESQRRTLWDHGIQREPLLTRMAFEFGAAIVASPCHPHSVSRGRAAPCGAQLGLDATTRHNAAQVVAQPRPARDALVEAIRKAAK